MREFSNDEKNPSYGENRIYSADVSKSTRKRLLIHFDNDRNNVLSIERPLRLASLVLISEQARTVWIAAVFPVVNMFEYLTIIKT